MSFDAGLQHDPWWSAYDGGLGQSDSFKDLLTVFHPDCSDQGAIAQKSQDMLSSEPVCRSAFESLPAVDSLMSSENTAFYNASKGSAVPLSHSTYGQAGEGTIHDPSRQQEHEVPMSQQRPVEIQMPNTDTVQDVSIPRRSDRIRKPSEIGYFSQRQETLQVFQAAVSNHRRNVTLCQKTLKDGNFTVKLLTDSRTRLESSIVRVAETFHKMVEVEPERYEKYIDLVNERETVNLQVLHDLTNCLRFVDTDHISAVSEKRSTVKGSSVKSGLHKSVSHKSSHSSRSSHTSTTVLKANVAALKAKLHFYDKEAEHKAQLERLKMMRNIAVEEAKIAALECSSVSQNLFDPLLSDIAQNCVEGHKGDQCVSGKTNFQPVINPVVNNVPHMKGHLPNPLNASPASACAANAVRPTFVGPMVSSPVDSAMPRAVHKPQPQTANLIDLNDPVLSAVGVPKTQSHVSVVDQPLNCRAPEFVPVVQNKPDPNANSKLEIDPHHLHDLFSSFSNLVHVSRLPIPEPGVFTGDPMQYPSWRKAFQTLIEGRNIAPADRIHYLQRYLKGDAFDCVQSLLLNPSDESYHEAMALIDKRFGNSYTIACAFKAKIESWPKVGSRDANGLRKFSDFLKQCEVAARSNVSLRVLDDDTQNRLMLGKLPDWLVSRWAREVHKVYFNLTVHYDL